MSHIRGVVLRTAAEQRQVAKDTIIDPDLIEVGPAAIPVTVEFKGHPIGHARVSRDADGRLVADVELDADVPRLLDANPFLALGCNAHLVHGQVTSGWVTGVALTSANKDAGIQAYERVG